MTEPRGELEKWCRANWDRVPEDRRSACIDHLRGWIPPDIASSWKEQHARGARIASDIPGFHLLGGGMQIRNRLRTVLPDDQLPEVEQKDGTKTRNWDDFYTGALEEFVEGL